MPFYIHGKRRYLDHLKAFTPGFSVFELQTIGIDLKHFTSIFSECNYERARAHTHTYIEACAKDCYLNISLILYRPYFNRIRTILHVGNVHSLVAVILTDTFASKVAAIQDKYADASVGNVTGSNAVNVFLGIGVAWTIGNFAFCSDIIYNHNLCM